MRENTDICYCVIERRPEGGSADDYSEIRRSMSKMSSMKEVSDSTLFGQNPAGQ